MPATAIRMRRKRQFKKAVSSNNFLPSLINLGNINFLNEDYAEALDYYNQVNRIKPDYPKVSSGNRPGLLSD